VSKRCQPVLRLFLRVQLLNRTLTGDEAKAARKALRSRGGLRKLADELKSQEGFEAACKQADDEQSETPIWDWLMKYLPTIISILVALFL
jgi:hypothetical protein